MQCMTLRFLLNIQNSCIHVFVPLGLHLVALFSPLPAAQCSGQTDGAGGGSGDSVLTVGCNQRQEPLSGWRCDYRWTF